MPKLTPDGEVLSAFMASQTIAMRALVRCLEDNGALRPGQFADALHMAMENVQDEVDVMTLAQLHELRAGILE